MAAPTTSFRVDSGIAVEEIEQGFLDGPLKDAGKRGGVGRQLWRVACGLRVELAVDAVGLEVEDDVAVLRLDETVDDALQQHVLLRLALRRREIA